MTNYLYDEIGIEALLSTHFNELLLSQMIKPCLIPAYELEMGATYFFCKQDHDEKEIPDRDFLIRDVCRATSAAPSYFTISANSHYWIKDGVPFITVGHNRYDVWNQSDTANDGLTITQYHQNGSKP